MTFDPRRRIPCSTMSSGWGWADTAAAFLSRRVGHALLLVLAGCSTGVPGGAGDLPGPLPSGVAFEEPSENALVAPDFSSELIDGTPVTASDLWQDRPVILVFTASWCARCRDVHRAAAEVAAEHDGAVGLLGVVAPDDVDGAREYAEELDLGHAFAVADEQVWLSYAVREPPLVALVAAGGFVLRGWPGGVESDVLARHVEELFAERPDGQ